MLRYLMDENVNPVYQTQLLRQDPDLVVWAVGDEGHASRIAHTSNQRAVAEDRSQLLTDIER